MDDLSFLIFEPAEVYHAKRDKYLSSHQLAEFRRNPLLFNKKQLGLVTDEDRPAFLLGRAAHALILEGREAYEREFAFGGPVNPKTGESFGSRTKAFQEWADAQGKPVLTDDQVLLIENLNAAVYAHEHAAALLADGVAEGVIRADYCGVACQARFDWVNPTRGIVDLKTCDSIDYLRVGRTLLQVRPPAGVLPGPCSSRHRYGPSHSPHRRRKTRAIPVRRLADGRGRPRDRAERERGGHRVPQGVSGERPVADWLRGHPRLRLDLN